MNKNDFLKHYENNQSDNNLLNENKKLKEELNTYKIQIDRLNNKINQLKNENEKLNNELIKANKLISNLNNNQNNQQGSNNAINNLKELIKQKDNEINNLKSQLNNNEKTFKYDDILFVHFISSDQNINCPIKCLKTDTFAEVEEKLYQRYEEYRETNNNFIGKGKIILRFKKICENNIQDGDKIQLIKIE